MPTPTARAVLGVSPTATPAEVRRAFRRRAHELHPDRNPSRRAAADFRALRAAYESLTAADGGVDGFDIEQVARDIEEAAREADRRRSVGGAATPAWQQVRVPLDRTARERLSSGLQTTRGRAGVGAGVALAVALGAGVPVAAGFAAWSLVAGAFGLGAGAALGAGALWTADDRPWAVDTHWRGVRDLRWDATVEWAEISEVCEGDGWLDLVITAAAARRLGRAVPPHALVRLGRVDADSADGGSAVAYRLPLRASDGLAGVVRHQLAGALAA
jgi:hypothetical protein